MRKDLELWLRGSESPRPAARGLSRRGFVVPGGASEWGLPVAFFPDLPAAHEEKSPPPAVAPEEENTQEQAPEVIHAEELSRQTPPGDLRPQNLRPSIPEKPAASYAKAADFIVVDLEKPVESAEPAEPKEAAANGEALAFIAVALEKSAETAEPAEEAETGGYAAEARAGTAESAEEIKPDGTGTGDFAATAEGDVVEESDIEESDTEGSNSNIEESGIEENDIGESDFEERDIDEGDEREVIENIEDAELIEDAEEPDGEDSDVFEEPLESEVFDSVEPDAGEPSGFAETAESAVEESERAVPEDFGRRRNETAFEERLRRIEMARRSASPLRRSGFRYRYGRFVAAGVIVFLVVGTVLLTYNHLRRNSYGFLMENAKTLYDSGKYEESLEAYREISLMYPNRVDPFMGLALASERAGRIEEAVEAYKCVLDLEPFFDFAQSELTRISEKAGDAE